MRAKTSGSKLFRDSDRLGLFILRSARVSDKLWRLFSIAYAEGGEIGQAQNFRHLHIVDAVIGVGGVVIVGVKAGEPPEGRNIVQNEGELVAAKENIQSRFMIEAVVQDKADAGVLLLHKSMVLGAVSAAN